MCEVCNGHPGCPCCSEEFDEEGYDRYQQELEDRYQEERYQ